MYRIIRLFLVVYRTAGQSSDSLRIEDEEEERRAISRMQKSVQEELKRHRKEQAIYESIYLKAGMGIVLTDNKGQLNEINPEFQRMIGYTQSELKKMKFSDITHPDDVNMNLDLFTKLLNHEVNQYRMEKRYIRKDGSIMWGKLTVTLMPEQNDHLTAVAFVEDITAQRETEFALEASEEKYHILFDISNDAIMVWELRGDDLSESRMVEANSITFRRYGYTREEFSRLSPLDINLPETSVRIPAMMERLMRDKHMIGEVIHVTKEGRRFPVEISSHLLERDNKRYIVSVVRDISSRKEMEARQKEQDELLIHQSRMAVVGEMTGAIAHQWRQPLNSLGLILQDIEDAFAHGELDQIYLRDSTRQAMDQILFMSKTIDDFRDFFKPSKSESVFDLKTILEEVLFLVRAQYKSNSIELKLVAREDRTYPVNGLKNEFKQVILNILNNARDAIMEKRSKEREGAEEERVEIRLEERDGGVRIRVEDTGGGIPDTVLPRVFESYFSTKGDRGTGVGLFMSKRIIEEKMGGRIVAGNGTKGAVFDITLDLARDP